MDIEIAGMPYEWVENWAQIPGDAYEFRGWAHPGMTVTRAGEIVTCHPSRAEILFFNAAGELLRSCSTDLAEAHGIFATTDKGDDFIWLADNGVKAAPDRSYQEPDPPPWGRVVKMTPHGEFVAELPPPPKELYQGRIYAPTSIAEFDVAQGGNGDIWVADGYGASLVHRYSQTGNYLGTLSGEEGSAGHFDTPHAVYIRTRKNQPELYIADRRNQQVQVYDPEGVFKRAFGQTFLTRPGGFAELDNLLVIAELRARLTAVDEHDRFVTYIGDYSAICDEPGWPNAVGTGGTAIAPKFYPGKFNSPHAIAADHAGNLYVTEWVIGGRTVKLVKRLTDKPT